jgi:predicted dehydrogenase
MSQALLEPAKAANLARPRIGFLGVGWIGRNRMEALIADAAIEAAAIADPSPEMAEAALALAPAAACADGLDGLLQLGLDGLVIATPSALHAKQSIRALEAGVAVFCQKPLGRTAAEVGAVIEAARRADRLLAVDLSYRFTQAMRAVRDLIQAGELGGIFAADLTFHNAYGPDKPWFYDPALSGGGCVADLGVHLVDLALWTLGFPDIEAVDSELFAAGRPLADPAAQCEDYAIATLRLAGGAAVRLACSWRLNAGCEAEIDATFYGERGAARMRNVGGSFYDFTAERMTGTASEPLTTPPDAWGGRAAVDWGRRLAQGEGFDPQAERLAQVAAVLDRIYRR